MHNWIIQFWNVSRPVQLKRDRYLYLLILPTLVLNISCHQLLDQFVIQKGGETHKPDPSKQWRSITVPCVLCQTCRR